MPVYTLSDLRSAQSQSVIRARLIAALNARGLPTDAWTPTLSGGPENTVIDMVAGALAALLGAKMAQAVEMRFLDLAAGDLLAYLALRFFLIEKNPATFTIQNVQLSSVATASSNHFEPGDLWVKASSTGNRYVNLDAFDLPPNSNTEFGGKGVVNARFQAEEAGAAYSDPAGTIDTMVTSPAGVSCKSAAPSQFLPATHPGSSTGTIVGSFQNFGGTPRPPSFDSVRVRIVAFGDIGSGLWEYSTNGGNTWISVGVITSVYVFGDVISNPGAGLTFTNGTTPSFIQGDIFTLIKGQAILQQGSDAELDQSLRQRCRDRWTTLSPVPTEGLVRLWSELATPEVTKVRVDADPNIPGGILVTLAGPAGPSTAAAQIAAADYIQARLLGFKGVPEASTGAGSPEETAQVRSATARQITPSGNVDVPRASIAAVQQEADRLWLEYLRGVVIGGTVILAELEQQIMDAGAITFSGILLNGVNQNLVLASTEVAVPADGTSLTKNLFWRPV